MSFWAVAGALACGVIGYFAGWWQGWKVGVCETWPTEAEEDEEDDE